MCDLKELVFAWKTLTNHLHKISNPELLSKMETINFIIETNSEDLFLIIYNFIQSNLIFYIKSFIILGNHYKADILLKNIKKLSTIINLNILKEDGLYTIILKLFINIENKHISSYKDKIKENIYNFCLYDNELYLNNIFKLAIDYKQYGLIDKLKHHVDINLFINKKKINIPLNYLLKYRGNKLINYLNI